MRFLMEQNAKTAHARPVVVAYPQVSTRFPTSNARYQLL